MGIDCKAVFLAKSQFGSVPFSILVMKKSNLRVGIVGKDGRSSAIAACLEKSARVAEGGVVLLSPWKDQPTQAAIATVLERAKSSNIDFAIVGPEEPLAEGIVDRLAEIGVPCVGPTAALARLESSKAFTRNLVSKHKIPGNPEFRVFETRDGIEAYLRYLRDYVVKPDGLTGGKGVKLSGEHLSSIEDALAYCDELLRAQDGRVVIEEKLDGEEFSLMSFCDGRTVKDMPVVQDHKRAHDGDTGPNTGGMGSYTCPDHSLPFLSPKDLEVAHHINKRVAEALLAETGKPYKGVLYGGFMVTRHGVRLLEYNARFGDPETLNVLSLLKTDFVDICEAIIEGTLADLEIDFAYLASVCKYIVPAGYPNSSVKKGTEIQGIPDTTSDVRVYDAAVERRDGRVFLTGSRAIGIVGLGATLEEAQMRAEIGCQALRGPVFYRRDIGTAALIARRVSHVKSIREQVPALKIA